MAFALWKVTSITTAHTSAACKTAGNWYGSMYGVNGYWLRVPLGFPAIGDITLAANANGNDGLYMYYTTATTSGAVPVVAQTIIAFERGGRWIRIANAGSPMGLQYSSGGSGRHKFIRLHYRAANEYLGPTNG